MSFIETAITTVNNLIWSTPMIVICLLAGVYFSIRMKFPQLRLLKHTFGLLVHGETDENGITPFQAFATTVGARVGMGNIAGVATAIYFSGPGAVFWMWLLALIGSASSFVECALAQAYKSKDGGQYTGGPAYYIEKGLKCKPYGIAFAIAAILGPGLFMPGVQTYSVASTVSEAFSVGMTPVTIVFCIIVAIVICGGIKRIGRIAEVIAPFMCAVYLIMTIIILVLFADRIPTVFAMIFKSAFGFEQAFAGIMGSTIAWGIKRGVYSNEAGQGSGAIVAASASCKHPAEQGLIQSLSVIIDTLLVCTCSALIILLTETYNVVDASGSFIVSNVPDVEYGILWAQNALVNGLGANWVGQVLSAIVVLFVFTSLLGYYYQAESNVTYIFKNSKTAIWVFRVIFILSNLAGVVVTNDTIWTMGDLGCGLMTWLNVIAILLLSTKGIRLLKDYEEKLKSGKEMSFDPAAVGIEDKDGVWSK
ncbi:alanine:cation symporter family protein [Anaerotignum lactatifermentans]|uniref:Alanine:cation symporter family protein n=1 Tax=Anaerotignum lactatifermentans TaxID=160404 RepID=A0ABS2G690_9FIRM|nr:alanine/glycine:cation symporter family protein [Anaerotignum lactatifermentans]MBM6828861.1 alanine:cation symporter family protein [Anaerotignum lactatifermentans]MBM6876966.1 alanine:cation symporter family protein [Anaerotignum lactatifermentans]MBM6950524.1 alanine:cation symporter family protein [Anaerotignum lactatifermentans]